MEMKKLTKAEKYYLVELRVKEVGTGNKVKIKAKKLTQEAKDTLVSVMLFEFIDAPRKELLQKLENVKPNHDK